MANQWKHIGLGIAAGAVLAAVFAFTTEKKLFTGLHPADAVAQATLATSNPDRSADEKAIRATGEEYVKAFNAGDPKAAAALWAPDAEYTDEDGTSYHGRDEILKLYTDFFKADPGDTINLNIESIRFLGPDIAVEKGIATVKSPTQETPTGARYTVVHARRDGKWIMVVGRDSPYTPGSNADYLKDLDWVIGEWKAEGSAQNLQAKFEWMAQKNFIKNTYSVTKDGQETFAGGQIIGWDPRVDKIVSWHFDPQGGFGHDVWTKDGSKWVIEAMGVFRNGSQSTAVNIVTPIDANNFTWQSVQRTLDGVRLPDMPPVKVTRVQAAGKVAAGK